MKTNYPNWRFEQDNIGWAVIYTGVKPEMVVTHIWQSPDGMMMNIPADNAPGIPDDVLANFIGQLVDGL